jgi:hypothetical protein
VLKINALLLTKLGKAAEARFFKIPITEKQKWLFKACQTVEQQLEDIKLLLEDENIDIKFGENGITPLLAAVEYEGYSKMEQLSIIELILTKNASPFACNSEGKNVLQIIIYLMRLIGGANGERQ